MRRAMLITLLSKSRIIIKLSTKQSIIKKENDIEEKDWKRMLEKQGQTHKQPSSMNSYAWTCQCWPTSKSLHQLCMNTGGSLEDLPEAMDKERESGKSVLSMWLDDDDDDVCELGKYFTNIFTIVLERSILITSL